MTDDSIEAKARDMVRKEDGKGYLNYDAALAALCRAIEQHEAFKQEVSDALVDSWYHNASGKLLERFIISKPDPLEEVIAECDDGTWETKAEYANKFRAALEARGLEIREKGQ
jgi:hypothetical protein